MDRNMHVYLVLALLAAVVLINRFRFNTQVLPGLYMTWDQSYLCERCGEKMIPVP